MNYGEALLMGAKRLSHCSSSPRLDAEVLLAHATGEQRSLLIAYPERPIEFPALALHESLLERRSRGEPVAYLTGHKEFYGLDLDVTPEVLVPRPETESVVDACLEALPPDKTSFLADIGTGSGAIAVAVAVHRPLCRVIATDVSAS